MSKEYLDVMHGEQRNIEDMAEYLLDLSKAFYMTGNTIIGNNLESMSQELYKSSNRISKAVGKEITDQYDIAQQISACITGIKIAK